MFNVLGTLYYLFVQVIYRHTKFRPRRWSPLYSEVLDREARSLGG